MMYTKRTERESKPSSTPRPVHSGPIKLTDLYFRLHESESDTSPKRFLTGVSKVKMVLGESLKFPRDHVYSR